MIRRPPHRSACNAPANRAKCGVGSGISAEPWRYRLGNRSAIDWMLDPHKEETPKDPTIREKFNTYRFADYVETVVDLLVRVVTVSLETVDITDAMAALLASAREQKKADA